MSQDEERQVQLNFLDEADEYLHTIESVLVELNHCDLQQMDAALRAAHTIKGIGSMIGCPPLSNLSHRLEDYFKILKSRQDSIQVDVELETLLLQGVDCMRQVSLLHRQDKVVEEQWLATHAEPVFKQLHERLGELQASDEAALLSEDEDTNIAVVMFESEVEGLLQRLEAVLADPKLPCLREELEMMAQELGELGQMLQLDAFTSLCASIDQQLATSTPEGVEAIARQALKAWHRSHALVMLGKLEKLPSQLEATSTIDQMPEISVGELPQESTVPLSEIVISEELCETQKVQLEEEAEATAVNVDFFEPSNLDEITDLNFSELAEAITNFDFPELTEEITNLDSPELTEAIANFDPSQLTEAIASFDPSQLQTETEYSSPNPEVIPVTAIEVSSTPTASTPPISSTGTQEGPESTVRVPVKLLAQLSDLFGELIIKRNTLNSGLKELENLIDIFRYRMRSLEHSNTQLQTFCHQIATEEVEEVPLLKSTNGFSATPIGKQIFPPQAQGLVSYHKEFDLLEMDRYSDLHLLSTEQRETIVQLQEVTGDIKLSLRDIKQTSRELNRSAKELQVNVAQTRMRPLSDIVGLFPRTVRDLSVQYGKTVELKIYGSSTPIDRVILEALRDPLMHLLRNAFDHGIEDPATREAVGKPPQGTIEIRAAHRGNQTLIAISDDGAGISIDKIRDRVIVMGMEEVKLHECSQEELLALIFEPGFSTASQVTALSGRGIGMDVVRTNLEKVRGDIKVDTELGVGTTFTISLPFTLSIVRVLLVESSGMRLAFPTDGIEEMVRLKSLPLFASPGQEFFNWEGLTVPLIHLEQWLEFRRPRRNADPEVAPIINEPTVLIISEGNSLSGIYIDRFWGEQEVVIRQVENLISLPPGFIGCTILEDGQVVPLADASKLLEWIASQDPSTSRIQIRPQLLQSSLDSGNKFLDTLPSLPQRNTILVVDDSINMRRSLAMTLEKAGYQVEQAKDGQIAVDKLVSGLSVQAVICDLEMPRLDGYGVLAEVKSNPKFKDLPIIILTSRSGNKHRQLAMRLGATTYFSKPYQEQELVKTIEQLLPK
ncbi:MAG: response regulator [Symploca sp. SIO3C6]|nr:response regulator [Symploca sp. SIO3C6]NET04266.1 response regulator [Symploca sp. SIO2B6]